MINLIAFAIITPLAIWMLCIYLYRSRQERLEEAAWEAGLE
jgi:hypothetical protein